MYREIPLWKFAIGAVIVSLPLLLVSEEGDWKWKYMLLIVLGFALVNSRGLQSFGAFISGLLRKG